VGQVPDDARALLRIQGLTRTRAAGSPASGGQRHGPASCRRHDTSLTSAVSSDGDLS